MLATVRRSFVMNVEFSAWRGAMGLSPVADLLQGVRGI